MRRTTFGLIVGFVLLCTVSVFAAQLVRLQPLTISLLSSTTTVGGTATPIPATALVGRAGIIITNLDSATKTLYIGHSSVSTSNGLPLDSTTPSASLDLDDSVIVYGICSSGNCDTRSLEAK